MFTDTINKCAANAARIARLSANNPLGFWVSSAMAGAYVGLGIILIFTLGNLVGSVFVALLYSWGGGSLLPVDTSIVHSVALAKTTAPATVLFFKGALCNWLVCLAIWMAIRTEGTAKFLAIWWCLLAFIASGYEHSVANMTLFALSWFGHHSDAYTLAGIGHNLLWVTLGNTLSGVVFMGLGYWYATPKSERPAPAKINQPEAAANN
ncbi:nitrite transporter NirC [Salmonella enterica subsp. enterica serovar Richmond]|nr:nitrite transporter NirC [Salmonella enterica subsp. enterica serovar Richmond]